MTRFSTAARLRKGALIAVDPLIPRPRVIVFQYTPDMMRRSLTAQLSQEEGARSEVQRLKGPPQEEIDVTVEIDATDQLEDGSDRLPQFGIYPQLSALELLLYPDVGRVLANAALMAVGTLEVIPPQAPLTLFVWGTKRVLPVRLNHFGIEEKIYDANLNPIRAEVSIGMRVLNYNDLQLLHPGYGLFLAHQATKEVMAALDTANTVRSVGGATGLNGI